MRWKQIIETAQIDHIDEALWWIIRYVSGSLTDEEWDWGRPTHLDINSAMEIVGKYIGNKKSIGRPLSRYILLDKNEARRLMKSKMLPVHKLGFQSFTTSGGKDALEIGRDINFGNTKRKVEVVITLTPPSSDVLFGIEDVAANTRKHGVSSLYAQWSDWEHQGEVFVRVNQPLLCSKIKIIGKIEK